MDFRREIAEILKEIGIAGAVSAFMERWWTKTIDGTHRGDVVRVLVAMKQKGMDMEVKTILDRLNTANQGSSPPLEDEMAKALHEFIPKKEEIHDGKVVRLVDWDKLDDAIVAFKWLANLPNDEFIAAINTAVHDPIRQSIKLAGHYVSEAAKTVAGSAVDVVKLADDKLAPVAAWTGALRGVQTKGKLW